MNASAALPALWLDVTPVPGADIEAACTEAVRLAGLLRVAIRFTFNGQRVVAKATDSPTSLAARFYAATEATSSEEPK